MKKATQARIESLVYQLRQCTGMRSVGVNELARRYRLDPMLVRCIMETEGLLARSRTEDEAEDEPQSGETQVLDLAELRRGSASGKTTDA
jgi:hypothetical protein